ncbi:MULTISPECIES: alpha/beta hydrolase [Niallia]|uniref:Alpha/beta hydrolase n=2 Tax=Bacillales TaxID=1385 RepID=A0A7Y0K6T5_9BACI|nr:alpha/beta hydrolase-fold protein [Niallia alba]NMO76642.1 alpha/beta hydrolase [Niallia alba]
MMIKSKESFYIPDTEIWTCPMNETKNYKIFVYIPNIPVPENGFPVLYLLDGNANFGSYVEAMRLQTRTQEKTGLHPAVIIGIGYETNEPYSKERYLDFTFNADQTSLPKNPAGSKWPPHGGGKEFLAFIEDTLKPLVEQNMPINTNKQMIVGHSLGGLFVLFTLFTSPSSFQYYLASSPSIHWNEEQLLEELDFLPERLSELDPSKLLLTVAEKEKSHFTNMHQKTLDLSEKLLNYHTKTFHHIFHEFKEEDHLTVLLPLINKTIAFLNDKVI